MGEILTLSGGKEIEIYVNCSIVRFAGKKRISRSAVIYMNRASVIYTAKNVNYFKKEFQQCVYKDIPKEIRKFCKEKTPGK